MTAEEFLQQCVAIDLEVNEHNEIYAIGAVLAAGNVAAEVKKSEASFVRQGRFDVSQALFDLDEFIKPRRYILGHNLLEHDLNIIQQQSPGLALLQKPVVDTLYLSPLAFPENPYHRLVKNYKLVRDAVNDPVADSRLAMTLFVDQWNAFSECPEELLALYRYCFSSEAKYQGLADLFEQLGVSKINTGEAEKKFTRFAKGKTCAPAVKRIGPEQLSKTEPLPALAYSIAWLQVAGGDSVLPPWVRHRFPEIISILRQLRDVPCAQPDCRWCEENHNPVKQLKTYFGFPSFREKPSTEDGKSLQREIVSHAMLGEPVLGILPTGGGKSLCFQLPALARYQRRGVLTIVVSPLQALMKDQVDNLRQKTGTHAVAALYGMLTPPERGAVLEGIRMGDVGILYVSPEQLRNRSFSAAISHREIGCWVFDEAHCLSKWGHDFRPDYLYAGRFIRQFAEDQKMEIPPVQCFTATAKIDVKLEIQDFFQRILHQKLRLFEGGVDRPNLSFEVHAVSRNEKNSILHSILLGHLQAPAGASSDGVAIVYCSSRKRTEDVAEFLLAQEWQAEAFHAGLDASQKRSIQEDFVAGETQVICATNAFGMGIDKDNVRVVVHFDIPGSLENYLQEAGRAGRDREDADCILLYDENDIESQFRLGAQSQLEHADIKQILKGLRFSAENSEDGEITLTSGELLRSQAVEASFGNEDHNAQTKVLTAIAWLERAGLLQRNENRTQVFQGMPTVSSLDEAKQKVARLGLSQRQQQRWLAILASLINADKDEGFSADQLAELAPLAGSKDDPGKETESQRVIRTLYDMSKAGLIKQSMLLTAYVRHKVKDHSSSRLHKIVQLEHAMLKLMQEEAPDAAQGDWQNLSIRRLNQRLLDQAIQDSNPEILRSLLYSLTQDGKGMAAKSGSLEIRHHGQDQYQIKLQRGWNALQATAELRQSVASAVLETILSKVPDGAAKAKNLMVEFSLDDLSAALERDMVLRSSLKDPLAAIDRALLFLHEQHIIILQNGLAIFRQSMTIRVLPEKRQYTKHNFEPLSHHYSERVFQIHVMNEYARIGLEKVGMALELVLAYFSLDKKNFVKRFFPNQKKVLERATSQQSWQQIVEDLGNKKQEAIVTAPEERNTLVLAGPGSGKTRTVVHRCAWLLRVKRVRPESILVLCFNRNAANLLRRKLYELVNRDAFGVTVQTYHGLAMRLTGRSYQTLFQSTDQSSPKPAIKTGQLDKEPDFDALILDAIALLKGEKEIFGVEPDQLRDRLLAGYRHILVDEYQDIDENQYELVSAIAGRTLQDKDSKLSLMAVGDDDQNIYQFRGANIEFIRRFQEDYGASVHYLDENYRSTRNIIEASNQLIELNKDRMKTGHPIIINKDRENLPIGGQWQTRDLLGKGRVQIIEMEAGQDQASVLLAELLRLKAVAPEWQWEQVAVVAREWSVLSPLRLLCEALQIPVCRYFPSKPPLFRIREIVLLLESLNQANDEWITAKDLDVLMGALQGDSPGTLWWTLLKKIQQDWGNESGKSKQPVSRISHFFYEALYEHKQQRLFGNGLLLSTVHSAKGLEFEHVFVMDGGWQSNSAVEEARRLYYVAMTRARMTLTLFSQGHTQAAFTKNLNGKWLKQRKVSSAQGPGNSTGNQQYALLTLEDFYLGYAGTFPLKHPIHSALQQLQAGDQLQITTEHEKVYLLSGELRVACFSKKACSSWLPRVATIKAIEIVAMVSWNREDSEVEYQHNFKTERWEIPLVEMRY